MIGSRLSNRYELLGELGRGGMAVVYRAHDPRLDRQVAVKMIATESLAEGAVERFEREAQLVAGLDHPAIVPIFDFGRHDDWLFFVMPVLEGVTLHRLFDERRLGLGELFEIVVRVADAIDYSAEHGVIHRDLKPENVMVALDEGRVARVWVMDFGLALGDASTRLTRTGNLPGTLAYLSPEQVLSDDLDRRSDLYSLVTILYEGLAGEPPFSGSPATVLYRVVHEAPPALAPHGVDSRLEALVRRGLAKRPEERFESGHELSEALRAFSRDEPTHEAAGPSVESPGEPTPLIGRDEEMAELRRRLHAALGGACQLVLVGGERGLGKSRLLREVEAEAKTRDVTVLRGRFSPGDGGSAYGAFGELIQDFYRRRSGGSSGDASAALPELGDLAPDLLGLFPALAEIPELTAASLDPGSRSLGDATHVYELIARALARLADGRPMVCLVEELHTADASVAVLQYLVRRLGPTPLLLVATYQPSALGRSHPLQRLLRGVHDDDRCVALELEPLDPHEHRRLVEHLLGAPVPEVVADRLYGATEGNPFFAEELTRHLRDTGRDSIDGDADVLGGDLPETIQQAVETRLERLEDGLQRLLGAAAVLGRRFEYRDLEDLTRDRAVGVGEDVDLDEALDALAARGLIEEERHARGDWLRFESALLREVVYSRLPRRKRRRLHRRAAERLEARWSESPERAYPRLLHHFAEGDVAEKAVRYGRLLAKKSLAAYGFEDAVRAARVALDFVADEIGDEAARAEGDLRRILAEAHAGAGDSAAAIREAGRAVRAFERGHDGPEAARAARLLVEIAWRSRRLDAMTEWLEEGLRLARGHDSSEDLAALLTLAATAANLRGETTLARRQLDEARRVRVPDPTEAAAPEPTRGGTLHVGMVGSLTGLEPATLFSFQDAEVLGNVYEPLVDVDAEGRAVPRLCRALSSREDGRVFTFQLRRDLVFSDGSPVDAEAVRLSIESAARAGDGRNRSAVAPIRGAADFLAGRAERIEGLVIEGELDLRVELERPLGMFPSLLSALGMAVARRVQDEDGVGRGSGARRALGTGPYVLAEVGEDTWTLERNERHRRAELVLPDRLVFHAHESSRALSADLRAGELDLARDLAPGDVEEFLASARFRGGVHEVTLPDIGFLAWNVRGSEVAERRLRRLLHGVLDVRELVWRSLTRFALPATSWIPPGLPGHDPEGSRPASIERFAAIEAMEELSPPVRLRALVHPSFADAYRALTEAILAEWSLLGVEVETVPASLGDLAAGRIDLGEFDLVFSRWLPDYLDPDAYCGGALHSVDGLYGPLVGSDAIDAAIDESRLEASPARREQLYRRLGRLLVHEHRILPLFHDVDYRVVAPSVGGVRLQTHPPFLDYRRVGRIEAADRPAPVARRSGHLRLALTSRPVDLDPAHSLFADVAEVASTIFEPLVRIDDTAEIVPHLAESIEVDGRDVKIVLRDVRFHDGRKLGPRDVRYSFERIIRRGDGRLEGAFRHVRGALALHVGQASELTGLRVVSDRELVIRLESSFPAFPALLSSPSAAIVPEGTETFAGSWRDGCVGTGPFRLVAFEPGRRIELAANVDYWRPELPRCQRLIFELGLSPARLVAELETESLHVVGPLAPVDLERLSRNPEYVAGLREHPSFSSYFAVFNRLQGPLADPDVRRRFHCLLAATARALVPRLGRLGVAADGLIPPGLLAGEPSPAREEIDAEILRGIRLDVALHPHFGDIFEGFWSGLTEALGQAGVEIVVRHTDYESMLLAAGRRSVDLFVTRWIADVPDPSTFAELFHCDDGIFGRPICHPRIDRLIEEGRIEGRPAPRRGLYRELERILAAEALAVPLFHEQLCRVAAPGVEGLRLRYGWPEIAYEELTLRR